jgi:uncharacterized membrane protein
MENIQKWLHENPRYFGIVLILFGIIVFFATLFNAKWLFNNSQYTYNLKKLDGWINIFGKKAGRIIGFIISILLIIAGIMYFVLWK